MARTKAVVLRLSEEEYNLLKELSGREPMNAYLRRVALVPEEVPKALREAREQFDAGDITAEKLQSETRRLTSGPHFRCPVCQRIYSSQVRCSCSNRLTVPS